MPEADVASQVLAEMAATRVLSKHDSELEDQGGHGG